METDEMVMVTSFEIILRAHEKSIRTWLGWLPAYFLSNCFTIQWEMNKEIAWLAPVLFPLELLYDSIGNEYENGLAGSWPISSQIAL